MQDLQVGILHPLTYGILSHLHVMNLFHGHIVGPTNTILVVIIKRGRGSRIWDIKATAVDALREITNTHEQFGNLICSVNLILTKIEGRSFLTHRNPSNQATLAEYDATAHTTSFEQWEQGAVTNSRTYLRAPTSVAI